MIFINIGLINVNLKKIKPFFIGIAQSTMPPLPLPIQTSVGFLVIGKSQG
jgi:hypothetical protein